VEPESSWSIALADYIRNNDQSLQEASKKLLTMFQDELLPCETFAEFCDVAGTNGRIAFLGYLSFSAAVSEFYKRCWLQKFFGDDYPGSRMGVMLCHGAELAVV